MSQSWKQINYMEACLNQPDLKSKETKIKIRILYYEYTKGLMNFKRRKNKKENLPK